MGMIRQRIVVEPDGSTYKVTARSLDYDIEVIWFANPDIQGNVWAAVECASHQLQLTINAIEGAKQT